MKKYLLFTAIAVITFIVGCDNQEGSAYEHTQLDNQLTELLDELAGGDGKAFYQFPASDDFANIPTLRDNF